MPAPRPQISVQNLEFAITRIKFEFNFAHAVIADTFEEPASRRFHNRLVDRFDEGAGIAELDRILADALSNQRGNYPPFVANGAKEKLIRLTAGNAFLDVSR